MAEVGADFRNCRDVPPTREEIRQLLAQGGMTSIPAAGRRDGASGLPAGPGQLSRYNGFLDPPGIEILGRALAAAAAPAVPELIATWDFSEDLLLAHIVARELNARVVRVNSEDGLFSDDGEISAGNRVLLVADAFRDARQLRALRALIAHQGGEVAGVAALVGTGALAGIAGLPLSVLLPSLDGTG